jgi:DNA-directed RNA polymerase subunit RPC12/RpoP
MATSDERREVAARLREDASCSESSPRDVVESYLGIEYDGADVLEESYTSESLLHIADLIDPTCKVMEVPDNDELKIRVVSGFMCKRCGHEDIVERNCDGSAEPPRFCPHCGARVVSHDDNQ